MYLYLRKHGQGVFTYMYSITWTEKLCPCSALEHPECCEQHKLLFEDYFSAALKYLALLRSDYICRVRIYKLGVGDIGYLIKTDREIIKHYISMLRDSAYNLYPSIEAGVQAFIDCYNR